MTVLVIVSSLFLLCLVVVVIRARTTRADVPLEPPAITRQHVVHEEGLWAVDHAQAQLRASIRTTSGSRLLGEKMAAAQARRLEGLPASRPDSDQFDL